MSILELQSALAALLPRLRRFARSLTHHREDADDLVQVAVERALRALDQYEPGTRLDSWMFRIMKNAWIDEQRARGRRAEVLAPEEAGEHVGVSETGRHIARLSVLAAMARLPEEQCRAIVLAGLFGYTAREIGEIEDIPLGTAKTRIRTALQRLRLALVSEERAE